MEKTLRLTLVLLVLACLVLVGARLAAMHELAAAAKIVASASFIQLARLLNATQSRYGRLILMGLVLSFVGDVFLIGESQAAFLAGLGAFLLAHIAYVAAFVTFGVSLRWVVPGALPMVGIAILVGSWLQPATPAALAVPVLAYIVVISSMVLAAFGTRGRGGSPLIVTGAVLFFASDLAVALQSIVKADFPHFAWGLPLYYAAQACLAFSVSQSRSH